MSEKYNSHEKISPRETLGTVTKQLDESFATFNLQVSELDTDSGDYEWELYDFEERLFKDAHSYIETLEGTDKQGLTGDDISRVKDRLERLNVGLPDWHNLEKDRLLIRGILALPEIAESDQDVKNLASELFKKALSDSAGQYDRGGEQGYTPIYLLAKELKERFNIEIDEEDFKKTFLLLVKRRVHDPKTVLEIASIFPEIGRDEEVAKAVNHEILSRKNSGLIIPYAVEVLEGLNIEPSQEVRDKIKESLKFCFLYGENHAQQQIWQFAGHKNFVSDRFGITLNDAEILEAIKKSIVLNLTKNRNLHSAEAVAYLLNLGVVGIEDPEIQNALDSARDSGDVYWNSIKKN